MKPVGQLIHTPLEQPFARFRLRVLDGWIDNEGEGWAAMRALLLGDTRSMSQVAWRDLRHLGVVHVLVISGLHIGLLASFCFLLVQLPRRLVRIPGDRGGMALISVSALMVTGCYAVLGRQPAGDAGLLDAGCLATTPAAWVEYVGPARVVIGDQRNVAVGPQNIARRQLLAQCRGDLDTGLRVLAVVRHPIVDSDSD